MPHALRRRYYKVRTHGRPDWALRRFRLSTDFTARELRLAFLREYGPLQAVPGKGATMECQRLIAGYVRLLNWLLLKKPPAYFVGAYGAFHEWVWHRKGGTK